jgi:protein SCO1/2
MTTLRNIGILMAFTAIGPVCLHAQSLYRNPGYAEANLPPGQTPTQLRDVKIVERLGHVVDLDLEFTGEDGNPHGLREYFFKQRPVILDLVYYDCPQLCTLVLNDQAAAMQQIDWTPGNEYEVVTISIDPHEGFDKARAKKEIYLRTFGKPAPGWHFLTDRGGNAARLAQQVGFHYRYDARTNQFAHPAAIMVLTPQGKMARYLYGLKYKAQDLRFALAEAGEDRVTMAVEKILLSCYMYDPKAGRYVLFATNFMKAGAVLVLMVFGWFGWRMVRVERSRAAHVAGAPRERTA